MKTEAWVSEKIRTLRHEGYPQKQAVAIALRMSETRRAPKKQSRAPKKTIRKPARKPAPKRLGMKAALRYVGLLSILVFVLGASFGCGAQSVDDKEAKARASLVTERIAGLIEQYGAPNDRTRAYVEALRKAAEWNEKGIPNDPRVVCETSLLLFQLAEDLRALGVSLPPDVVWVIERLSGVCGGVPE